MGLLREMKLLSCSITCSGKLRFPLQIASNQQNVDIRGIIVSTTRGYIRVEVCMGMGKTGIPWVPWDSHGNGYKISLGMGMGIKCMGMGAKTWELSPATVNSLLFLHSNME